LKQSVRLPTLIVLPAKTYAQLMRC
jgi:hypothetical protein